MKLPKNIILAGVLILLVTIAWAYQGPYKNWQHKRKLPNNFLKIDGVINKIEIDNGKRKITLAKEGDNWRVYGQEGKFNASPIQMKTIVESLSGLGGQELEVASNNPKKQEDFLITGKEAIKVVLKSDKSEIRFNVGKSTPSVNGSYVGHDGDTNTYRLNSVNLRQTFGREEWRDYSLFNLDFKQPNFLRLQYPDHETKMTLRDDEWVNNLGKIKYNKEQIDKVASTLVGLFAVQIPKQDFKPTGLDKPAMIIQFKGDGFDETLMLGKRAPKNMYYAKTGKSDNIYLINSTEYDTLTQKEMKPIKEPKEPAYK